MPSNLFNKLPEIWKTLDLRVTDVLLKDECQSCGYTIPEDYTDERCPQCGKLIGVEGMLERFLNVPDSAFERIENFVGELLRTHNVQIIQDRFLPLLTDLVGHNWRDDKSRRFNRERIQSAITRHSYKGTELRLRDEVKLAGSDTCDVQDNASRLMIVGKQGRIGCTDCVIMDHNFWHDGSFELAVDHNIDFDELALGMAETTAAGELWWLKSVHSPETIFAIDCNPGRKGIFEDNDLDDIAIGRGVIGQSFWIGFERIGSIQLATAINSTNVIGGYLTVTSNLRVSHTIPVDEGTATNPLSVENALLQESPEITEILPS